MSSTSSALRPAWRNSSGGRGFQPPPSVGSERGRSQSIGSTGDNSGGENRAYNKFAALDDDEDGMENAAVTNPAPPKGNSRSEALRQGLGPRASSKGGPSSGRRLADLAATAPEQAAATRGYSGRYSSRSNGNSAAPPVDEGKVIRFTRERLLSMRPAPSNSPPEVLTPLVGNVIISELPQDPVCWDNFDAEEIWAAVPRRASAKAGPASGRSLSDIADGAPPGRSRREMGSTSGRWQRGVALPPPSAADKARKDRDAENPNDLWDDPISGGPAGDFSAFGDMGNDEDDAGWGFYDKKTDEWISRHFDTRSLTSSNQNIFWQAILNGSEKLNKRGQEYSDLYPEVLNRLVKMYELSKEGKEPLEMSDWNKIADICNDKNGPGW